MAYKRLKKHLQRKKNKKGILLLLDPPHAIKENRIVGINGKNPVEGIVWDGIKSIQNEKKFETITMEGSGVNIIREELKDEVFRFATNFDDRMGRNFKPMAIFLPSSSSSEWVAMGVDANGPGYAYFGEKASVFKKIVKWIKDYGIPIGQFAYLIINMAKESGLLNWLLGEYPSYQPYANEI